MSQPPPHPGHPPPRRGKKGPIAVIAAVSVLLVGGAVTAAVLAFSAATGDDDGPATTSPSGNPVVTRVPAPARSAEPFQAGRILTVTYEITGDGPADIDYSEAGFHMVRVTRAELPWTRTLTMRTPAFLSVSASSDHVEGELNCRITVDGRKNGIPDQSGSGLFVGCVDSVTD